MRIGIGYDIHPLIEGRRLIIGGVEIDYPLGLVGHSDADVLIHAVIDAVLGAAGEGDIGKLFPDTDPSYAGISSLKLLERVSARLSAKGYRLVNLDATVILERPRIAEFSETMAANIARGFGVGSDAVNIKATTNEGLGEIGSGHAAAAWAAVLLDQASEGNNDEQRQ